SSHPPPRAGPISRPPGSPPRRCSAPPNVASPSPPPSRSRPFPRAWRKPPSAMPCRKRRCKRSAARRRGAKASRCCSRARNSRDGDAMTTTRRNLLSLIAGGSAFAVLGLPCAVFAAAPGDRRLVVVLLRGALDGLAAVPPLGDPRYAEKRGSLALTPQSALPLDRHFALHPALAPL